MVIALLVLDLPTYVLEKERELGEAEMSCEKAGAINTALSRKQYATGVKTRRRRTRITLYSRMAEA
jgi:hypothetical protein